MPIVPSHEPVPRSNAAEPRPPPVARSCRCRACGYALVGVPTPVCPECGEDYGDFWRLVAECGDRAERSAEADAAVQFGLRTCAGMAILSAAVMVPHYAAAGGFGAGAGVDPKQTAVFALPVVGGFVQTVAVVAWGAIPIFCPIAFIAALVVAARKALARDDEPLRRRFGAFGLLDVASFLVVIAALVLYSLLGVEVLEWACD